MAEDRDALVGEEHVREILQRVERDAALLDEAVGDRLAGDLADLLQHRVGVADAVGRRDDVRRHFVRFRYSAVLAPS